MSKYDPELSHAEIKAKILGVPNVPTVSPARAGLVAAGNPDVLAEAADRPDTRYKSGRGWTEGMRAWGGPIHLPGKNDGPNIGRRRPITY